VIRNPCGVLRSESARKINQPVVSQPSHCLASHGKWVQLEWHHLVGSGWFGGKDLTTSRVSPPGPLSISYGHVGCLKARAFPPPV
jgi:hypothetical protein